MDHGCTPDEALEVLRAKLTGYNLKALFLAHGSCGKYYEVIDNSTGKRVCLVLICNPTIQGPWSITFEFIDHDSNYPTSLIIKAVVKVL